MANIKLLTNGVEKEANYITSLDSVVLNGESLEDIIIKSSDNFLNKRYYIDYNTTLSPKQATLGQIRVLNIGETLIRAFYNTGNTLLSPRQSGGGCTSIITGGGTTMVGKLNSTENVSDTACSMSTNINIARTNCTLAGTETDCALFGDGFIEVRTNTTWSQLAIKALGIDGMAAIGSEKKSIMIAGDMLANTLPTELFDGTRLTSKGNLTVGMAQPCFIGTGINALILAGCSVGDDKYSQSWNGTAWSNVDKLVFHVGRASSSSTPSSTNNRIYGGINKTKGASPYIQQWNGITWGIFDYMNTPRIGGFTTSENINNSLICGGWRHGLGGEIETGTNIVLDNIEKFGEFRAYAKSIKDVTYDCNLKLNYMKNGVDINNDNTKENTYIWKMSSNSLSPRISGGFIPNLLFGGIQSYANLRENITIEEFDLDTKVFKLMGNAIKYINSCGYHGKYSFGGISTNVLSDDIIKISDNSMINVKLPTRCTNTAFGDNQIMIASNNSNDIYLYNGTTCTKKYDKIIPVSYSTGFNEFMFNGLSADNNNIVNTIMRVNSLTANHVFGYTVIKRANITVTPANNTSTSILILSGGGKCNPNSKQVTFLSSIDCEIFNGYCTKISGDTNVSRCSSQGSKISGFINGGRGYQSNPDFKDSDNLSIHCSSETIVVDKDYKSLSLNRVIRNNLTKINKVEIRTNNDMLGLVVI